MTRGVDRLDRETSRRTVAIIRPVHPWPCVDPMKVGSGKSSLITFRAGLEPVFVESLAEHVGRGPTGQDVPGGLSAMVAEDRSPALCEFLVHRSLLSVTRGPTFIVGQPPG